MVTLRPLTLDDAPTVGRQWSSIEDSGEQNWFGFRDSNHFERRLANGLIKADSGQLGVVDDDGTLVGEVSWIKVFNGPPPNADCWNLGIWMVPEHRGKGYGSAAQRLAAAYLFEHTLLERVEAGTESDNIGEQRALEKAGFTREGVLRRACFRGGAWHDMVVYSKLRGEP